MNCEKLKDLGRLTLRWILNKPKTLVKIVVLSACFGVVVYQLYECAAKLIRTPIATHSYFDLNETMQYPAVTFCREPPYKQDVLVRYNLSVHPQFESNWDDFDFDVANLSQLFEDSTYKLEEFFGATGAGLHGSPDNVKVRSTMNFNLGKCYTVRPASELVKEDYREYLGYSIELNHSLVDIAGPAMFPPGWHVFIHEVDERFTEEGMRRSGRVEYLYMELDEELILKITAQHFSQLSNQVKKCSQEEDKGTSICGELCKCQTVTDQVGCTGPWMPLKMRMCNSTEEVKELISAYKKTEIDEKSCNCLEPCKSVIYTAFVVNRKSYKQYEPRSLFRLHYSSKMVVFIEEMFSYGFSQFIADIGGSLGFLLGLSVIGIITILEKLLEFLFMGKSCQRLKGEKIEITPETKNNESDNDNSSNKIAYIHNNLKY